jgi:hypothetical protein
MIVWTRDQISFAIDPVGSDADVGTIRIATPAGALLLMGVFGPLTARILTISEAHTDAGPGGFVGRNAIGVANLIAIAQAFILEFDYDGIIIEGAARTTGRRRGKRPRPFRVTRHPQN